MKANYHQVGGSIELDVIGKIKDGKCDLGRGKDVLVQAVTIAKPETAEHGTCTLLDDGKEAADEAAKKAADEAAKKAAEEAAKKAAASQ